VSDRQLLAAIGELHTKVDNHSALIEALTQTLAERVDPPLSYSVKTWCARHELSLPQYYKLSKAGKGPRLMAIGSEGVRVSRQADLDWVASASASARTWPTRSSGAIRVTPNARPRCMRGAKPTPISHPSERKPARRCERRAGNQRSYEEHGH
jgi:hypothetical protein